MTGGLGPSFDPARIDAIRAQMAAGRQSGGQLSPASRPPARKPEPARPQWQLAGMLVLGFAALLYLVEFVNVATSDRLDNLGIEPRTLDGLWGIVFAPVLHANWAHLIANTLPLLVLGFLVLLGAVARGIQATAIIWLVAGVGTWLIGGAHTNHIGASSIIFGWLTYLLTRGLFTRSPVQIGIGIVVFLVYGGLLWGVFPADITVSWQGHLCGAIGGVLAAWLLGSAQRDSVKRLPAAG